MEQDRKLTAIDIAAVISLTFIAGGIGITLGLLAIDLWTLFYP